MPYEKHSSKEENEPFDVNIQIRSLKEKFWDELVELSPDGEIGCKFEEIFKMQISFIEMLRKYYG